MFDSNIVNWNYIYVRVTPYIGIAYYDGADDGTYTTPTGSLNIANGAYPNLYNNNQEYGNYVLANPIVLGSPRVTGGSWYNHELKIQSREDHCPLINIPVHLDYNRYAIGFDILNNAVVQPTSILGGITIPSPASGTPSEEQLLREYGKVFYYKVEYGTDPFNFNPDVYYVLALEADMGDSEWASLSLSDFPFGADLHYHSGSSSVSSTKEIIVDPESFTNKQPEYKKSGELFGTSVGGRKIVTIPTGIPIYPPSGPVIPGAEPRGVYIEFH